MTAPLRRSPLFGPEPWATIAGVGWCHFDRWFALVAVTDFGGNLDSLQAELVGRHRSSLHGRADVEAKLSHLADLRSRMAHAGIDAAALGGYEPVDKAALTKARRKVLDQALEHRSLTTVDVISSWRVWQQAQQRAAGIESRGWMFTDADGEPIHPHAISQTFERITRRAGVRVIRLHDLRHTHGTLLIAAGVPVKTVSERLGHATPTFTIDTYQHVLPGMQADAARTFEQLVVGGLLPAAQTSEKTREKRRKKTA